MMIDKKGRWCYWYFTIGSFTKTHKHIFEAIFQLFTDSQPVDLLTVSAQLKRMQTRIGWWRFLFNSAYAKDIVFGTYWVSLRIILQKFIQRSLIQNIIRNYWRSYDETTDVFDLLTKLNQTLRSYAEILKKFRNQSLVIQAKKELKKLLVKKVCLVQPVLKS
jgi:replicative DNA helicase